MRKRSASSQALPVVFLAANRTRTVGIQLVDDDVVNGELEAVRLAHDRDGLAEAHCLGQHHGNKTAAARILQDGFHPLYRAGQFVEKGVEIVAIAGAGKNPFHVAMLGQKRLQHGHPFAQELRHGEQPQSVAAGRGVYDDAVVDALLHPGGYLQESHEFIQAGQGEIQEAVDFLIVKKSSRGMRFRAIGRRASS